MRSRSIARGLAVLAVASAGSWVGCGGGSDVTGPPPGSLDLTIATAGPEPDADGYTTSIDGAPPKAIATNTTSHTDGLAAGSHTVELGGLAGNCTVATGTALVVEIDAGSATTARFDVVCAATTGTIEVATASTGSPADSDGYTLALDQGAAGPIGTDSTVSVPHVAPGSHTVTLGGLAATCSVADNPRSVTVAAGTTSRVAFSVTCAPNTGAITITTTTTGDPADPDGYTVSLDGSPATAVATSGSATIAGLAPGSHNVLLEGIASNCKAQGQNPRTTSVAAGDTASIAFTVACSATTGALTVTIAGLPAGTNAAVTVTGPNSFSAPVTATATLADLAPGSYTVAAADVTIGGKPFAASPRSRSVSVTAGRTAGATVTYTAPADPTVNLRIDGLFLAQSVQSAAGDVPMVQDRDGFLRVFVLADAANNVAPSVRVRAYRNGVLARTFDIPAPGASTPVTRNDDDIHSSWNVKIPSDVFGPGLALLADVDPSNAIAEKDESDNSYPASGTPLAETVSSVPPLDVRFVPIRQQTSGLTGDVSAASLSSYLQMVDRIYPVQAVDADLHEIYTTSTTDALVADDANGAWVTVLNELDAVRVAEGTDRTYYGVVQVDYGSGIAGLGNVGIPSAIGFDRAADRSHVMAHELGHTFNRLHAPCGQASSPIDPSYPYAGGLTGSYGYDVQTDVLKSPFLADIMGYCLNPWISDYTYQGVLAFRAGQASAAARTAAAVQPCLLVWGRIVDGRPVLEPAFEVVTRPSLPKAGGPYAIEALDQDGSRKFRIPFDAARVEDDRRDVRQFAFAVPLGGVSADRIASLRLSGTGGEIAASRIALATARTGTETVSVTARVSGQAVRVRWDAAAHPMVMVRDPDTGEILSLARGGEASVVTGKRMLDVVLSDRIGSRAVRVEAAP